MNSADTHKVGRFCTNFQEDSTRTPGTAVRTTDVSSGTVVVLKSLCPISPFYLTQLEENDVAAASFASLNLTIASVEIL